MTHRDAVQQIAAAPIAVVALLKRFPIPRAAAYVRRDDDISETHEELCDRIVRVGLVTALGLAGQHSRAENRGRQRSYPLRRRAAMHHHNPASVDRVGSARGVEVGSDLQAIC